MLILIVFNVAGSKWKDFDAPSTKSCGNCCKGFFPNFRILCFSQLAQTSHLQCSRKNKREKIWSCWKGIPLPICTFKRKQKNIGCNLEEKIWNREKKIILYCVPKYLLHFPTLFYLLICYLLISVNVRVINQRFYWCIFFRLTCPFPVNPFTLFYRSLPQIFPLVLLFGLFQFTRTVFLYWKKPKKQWESEKNNSHRFLYSLNNSKVSSPTPMRFFHYFLVLWNITYVVNVHELLKAWRCKSWHCPMSFPPTGLEFQPKNDLEYGKHGGSKGWEKGTGNGKVRAASLWNLIFVKISW